MASVPIGSKVRKFFEGYGWFNGTVVSYCDDDEFYKVLYDDNDEEELDQDELKNILVASTGNHSGSRSGNESSYDTDDLYHEDGDEEDDDDRRMNVSVRTPMTNKSKKAVPITPSPSKSSTPTLAQAFSSASSISSTITPRSIAVRGLPRGALGKCQENGFTIRTLDGIPPLVTAASASSNIVSPVQTPLKRKSFARSSSSLSTSSNLPGRLLVVAADRQGLCPRDLVGQTFASATDLHSAMDVSSPWATYDMEAVADPTFASWDFVQARLISAGLLEDETKEGPFVVRVEWDGRCKISGDVSWYEDFVANDMNQVAGDLQWAIIEGDHGRDVPPVVVGAPLSLIEHRLQEEEIESIKTDSVEENSKNGGNSCAFLPLLSQNVAQIRLPASLLQKAIRRGYGNGICSPAPLLVACASLLLPNKACPGSTLAMLKTVWGCMLTDASPFTESSDCLGLSGLLLLSLIATADPNWIMPRTLRRASVAAALRTATSAPSQPWIGFVRQKDEWWRLESVPAESDLASRAANLRNVLRAAQVVTGGRLSWGKWGVFTGDSSAAAVLAYLNDEEWQGSLLPEAPLPHNEEASILTNWEEGKPLSLSLQPRLLHLDEECRLAAMEPTVMPHSLVLLQAVLRKPPTNWKKHGLPALSKQIRKLVSEANPRHRQRIQLARLATWGKDKTSNSTTSCTEQNDKKLPSYDSFRQVVTPTGTLSEGEKEVVDCFEAVQQCFRNESNSTKTVALADSDFPPSHHVTAGPPPNAFEGRVAFILAFGGAVEVEVHVDSNTPEVVSAMFCGDSNEPLLVQRIGKARKEGTELATAGGTSGATAVPSLGYVKRSRSDEEKRIMEAAELKVAAYWKGGRTEALPTPPQGLQWELLGNESKSHARREEVESSVVKTAEIFDDGSGKKAWRFTIGGITVAPFDARSVISSCKLDHDGHRPVSLEHGSQRSRFLRIAMYLPEDTEDGNGSLSCGKAVLQAMAGLHTLAISDRSQPGNELSEGSVYDWTPLAKASPLPSRTWRDALLAIRTRERDHVSLGKGIRSDGTGAVRDMTEGVLLRLFYALEMLYPTALKKEGAIKFRVRPRGAAYHHMMVSLEHLGRGELFNVPDVAKLSNKNETSVTTSVKLAAKAESGTKRMRREHSKEISSPLRKRPRRVAAVAASDRIKIGLDSNKVDTRDSDYKKENNCMEEDSDVDVENSLMGDTNEEYLPLPEVVTNLWTHQEASVSKVVQGVCEGKRGHADASAVGAGKTLMALATIVRLAQWIEGSGRSRHGVLVMLPTKALIKEWLLEIATHTKGFHIIEQREDGTLFSLTYSKTHPPIDGNSLVISTLDRVSRHPFVRQCAWDFVVIDECLSVQNASAKRNPSAWRQIEVSVCGVLMLSATFFRSNYECLFYMIRMLRSPLPRTMAWLPATIHEHIVCQIPETDRHWKLKGEMVSLASDDLLKYRKIIEVFKRRQLNQPGKVDGRKLWVDLESFLRSAYEGRDTKSTYRPTSVMAEAFARIARGLLRKKRRPLVFADTSQEADFLLRVLRAEGLDARTWASVASEQISSPSHGKLQSQGKRVIVAVKSTEGQGLNMQKHADSIVCRPTPGDHLEQMKGRIDRPGQAVKDLLVVVLMAEHTIEEAKFANIRLAGNFFREYLSPVASRYREQLDLEATLAAGGTKQLKRGTVSGTWRRSLESAGQSGAFASIEEDSAGNQAAIDSSFAESTNDDSLLNNKEGSGEKEPKYKPLNKVIRNKGDPVAVRQAKSLAKSGLASLAVRRWLFPPKGVKIISVPTGKGKNKPLPKESLQRFSDKSPPLVLDPETVQKAVTHLSNNDPKLAALIARIGSDVLVNDCGKPKPPTQARLFDRCLRAITFTMVSVDAGNAFLRRLTIKIGVCIELMASTRRKQILRQFLTATRESNETEDLKSPEELLQLLLQGEHKMIVFTVDLLRELAVSCEEIEGKRTGYPHLCGVTFPCGKNDDPRVFLEKARAHAKGGDVPVSAGFSAPKASFIIALVDDFDSGKISGEKIAAASDREAAKMLLGLKGIGDWCAGGVLMHFLNRADVLLYGDLTIRNYLNDLYDINHQDSSETLLESAADFADTGPNRNLIDALAKKNKWEPYRSVVCLLMYHLQEENLVLL